MPLHFMDFPECAWFHNKKFKKYMITFLQKLVFYTSEFLLILVLMGENMKHQLCFMTLTCPFYLSFAGNVIYILYLRLRVDTDAGIDIDADARKRKQSKDICNIVLLNSYSLWIQSDSLCIFLTSGKIDKLEFSLCSSKYLKIRCHCISYRNKTFWIILMFKCILVLSSGKVLWTHLHVDMDSIEVECSCARTLNFLEDYF